jgi:hypothetical protein
MHGWKFERRSQKTADRVQWYTSANTLWSIAYSSCWHIEKSRVRFSALPLILRNDCSETWSSQPRGDNWEATWMKKYGLRPRTPRLTAVRNSRVDHAIYLYPQKLALTFPRSNVRPVYILHLRTQSHGVFCFERFEIFTAVTMKNDVFCDVTPCDSYKNRRVGGTQRLLHQGDENRRTRNISCN